MSADKNQREPTRTSEVVEAIEPLEGDECREVLAFAPGSAPRSRNDGAGRVRGSDQFSSSIFMGSSDFDPIQEVLLMIR